MPFIENCAASDISSGFYYTNPGANSMLIQITDPKTWETLNSHWFPEPEHKFKEVHQFEFLDIEAADFSYEESWRFSEKQADDIAKLLIHALESDMNVIVHCFAGVSRSGAVCEIGVKLGFEDKHSYRSPNELVMFRLKQSLKALGKDI